MVWPLNKKDPEDNLHSRELSRIQQSLNKASWRHPELSGDGSPEKRVKETLAAYERLKNVNAGLSNDFHSERQAKLQAQQQHESQFQRLISEHTQRIAGLQAEHTEITNALQQGHDDEIFKIRHEIFKIRQENEDLKQNLSSREHIKGGLTDRDVVAKFKKLNSDIEDFARIEWDPYRETAWPVSEIDLRRLHPKNIRKLKQQIVQNSLWLALQEYIFRTPFRIIGDHGSVYDSTMYEAYSREYDEKGELEKADLNMKRYENAKVFLAALNSTDQRSANDKSIQESYDHSRAKILGLICQNLTKVTPLGQGELDALDDILQVTARLWLEVCSQRYRLFVIPEDSQDILSSARRAISSLRLVGKPALQRFGNLQGTDIRQGEMLAGWKSQIQEYPTLS